MSGNVLTSFCYPQGSIGGDTIHEIVTSDLGFEPTHIRCADLKLRQSVLIAPRRLEALFRLGSITHLSLETERELEGPTFEVATLTAFKMQVLYWKTPNVAAPPLELLNRLSLLPEFNAGFTADADDVFWQSEETLSSYQIANRPIENLPLIDDSLFGGKKVDVRSNAGRRALICGMWLAAGWRMWFGSGALRYVDREALLSFNPVVDRKQLGSSTIFIQLYD